MRKTILTVALTLCAMTAMAYTPSWLRFVQISPDGRQIAFCYKGDIYRVAATGGEAVRLTTQASYETTPVWSPDGTRIAFASDRHGSFDIFVMNAGGGTATRLTTHSAAETPMCFSGDGKYVYYSAAIQDPAASAQFPSARLTEVYKVPVTGGRPVQTLATPAEKICFNRAGTLMLYQDRKGGEDEYRKHHTSSITRDVWVYDTKTGRHTNLTARGGEDRNPVFSPDEQTVYFLSERQGGSFNVYRFPLSSPKDITPVTSFTRNPVRFLSIARDGTLCFSYDGEIYTQAPGATAAPRKVDVSLTLDDENLIEEVAVRPGAGEVSPDGKQMAYTSRGEVFVTSLSYNTTKQITHTAQAERGVSWHPKGRTIVYASERSGNWQLFTATIARSDEPNFANATLINEKALLPSTTVERFSPQYSPDGKELAFIEDRCRLMVLNLASGKVRQITDGSQWIARTGSFSYAWSPDSKWFSISFMANGHAPYGDCGIVSAQGGEIYNVTSSGYFDSCGQWVLGGNALIFSSDRYGMRSHGSWGSQEDVMMVFTNQDAYDRYRLSKEDYEQLKDLEKAQKAQKAKADKAAPSGKGKAKKAEAKTEAKPEAESKDIKMELEGMDDRVVRLTTNSSDLGAAALTNDGETLYYTTSFNGSTDLWKLNLRKRENKLVSKGIGHGSLQMMDDGKTMYLIGGQTKKIELPAEKVSNIAISAKMRVDHAAEREYMFNHVVMQERQCFFVADMRGCDWDYYADTYRKFLPHINNNYDFANMLSELLGELNVSHTGGRFRPSVPEPARTASLGLLYDLDYKGDGLRVSEIIAGGPFDRATTQVTVGTVLEKIDGQALTAGAAPDALLTGIAGKKTLVSFYNPATGKRWDEVIKPVSPAAESELLYERWVKARAADVERLSGGRLGYVHIQGMNDASFRKLYRQILGKYYQKEGIVIDTRFNGGGRLHEDLEQFFTGQKYLTMKVRGKIMSDVPTKRWNKPSIMLQGEANYSNAHGSPWVYKHQKIGKLVGMPVPGTMSSVSWETLQDRSLVFGIPAVGFQQDDGTYLEGTQLEPDIKIANKAETLYKGEDLQLKAAVDALLHDIDQVK